MCFLNYLINSAFEITYYLRLVPSVSFYAHLCGNRGIGVLFPFIVFHLIMLLVQCKYFFLRFTMTPSCLNSYFSFFIIIFLSKVGYHQKKPHLAFQKLHGFYLQLRSYALWNISVLRLQASGSFPGIASILLQVKFSIISQTIFSK